MKTTGWILSPAFDVAFILGPGIVISLVVVLLPQSLAMAQEIPLWVWVLAVLGIDVAHVYSTLFRTYFDKEEFAARRTLYTMTPLLALLIGALAYSYDGRLFWRCLAYLAVFHFVRQQYGFMAMYGRAVPQPRWGIWVDRLAIYFATLYPLLYWHLHLPRRFEWFVPGDFVALSGAWFESLGSGLYVASLLAFVGKELAWGVTRGQWNIPKILLLGGTALSWYLGIVYLDGDLTFTLTNVVTHGIPYMALVWGYQRRKQPALNVGWFRHILQGRFSIAFLLILVGLAYAEEFFWDAFVWRERGAFFLHWLGLPAIQSPELLSLLVPLLAVPQITHYVLDAFIWRVSKPDAAFKELLPGAL